MLGVLRSATEIGWRLVCLSMCMVGRSFLWGGGEQGDGWKMVDEMLQRIGDMRGDGGEVGSHRFAEFLSCIPFSLALWEKKSIISKNTLFLNWPFREKKRGRGGVNLVRGLGCN